MKLLMHIFWTFFKIGPATFGGGYAMIPVIEREVVHKNHWISEHEMSDMLSIAGSAPGGIGVNASTFVGFRLSGLSGALAAVVGITLPTFMIAFLLSLVFAQVEHNPKITAALEGIHWAIVGLIIIAAYRMSKVGVFDKTTKASLICTVVVLLTLPIHPVVVIIIGLFIGIVFVAVKEQLGLTIQLEKASVDEMKEGNYKYHDYFIAEGI